MMRELYEIATLSAPLIAMGEASAAARDWVGAPDAQGALLGAWRTEHGALGRLLVLRVFLDADMLAAERRRALLSANPFNAANVATALDMESYAPFPFLPAATPRAHGGFYEFRTYWLKPGGLPPTLAGWERAIAPARAYTAHLVINMHGMDGPPRITHVWGFASLAERMALRSAAYGAGVWPPKGGPENIREASSSIALPEPWSPLS
jgi:hypothetical protein